MEGSDEVHLGKDGWLMLVGGSNDVLSFFVKDNAFPEATQNEWINLFNKRKTRCDLIGSKYFHIIVPDKLTIYQEKYRGSLPFADRVPSLCMPAASRKAGLDVIVDIVPNLLTEKERHKLYWKTDTHWTFEGCYSAFKTLCPYLGVARIPEIDLRPRIKGSLILDLGGKLNPAIREDYETVNFIKESKRVAANSIVLFKEMMNREQDGGLHVGSNVVYCNWSESAIQKTVVLFGDSFSEYRPHLLTGMLAETFREVHFIWSTNVDWTYVENVKPDYLVTEAAERFMNQVPTDTFNLVSFETSRLAPLV